LQLLVFMGSAGADHGAVPPHRESSLAGTYRINA